ncbi:ABC transporter ATP-binding protein [Paenibacillus oleatilyticus]|uniref:ABC transporter ATP-binding protein n=1 Tax=Paenibacillus oleatilyticus TaxID=2594886 RepID=UPI001C1F7364|nr:ABC transporter ATP-binding protein [Paenibacillus oleatilyticus]MBU7316994.1 ABC transporter ATP-binding protein [Paenibacillus oleatilyticus]
MQETTKPILEVSGLTKRFKAHQALKGISFAVYPGEILCFLGPNGAGKSTTIHILSTALQADAGEIRFRGTPVAQETNGLKRSIGIVPQDLAIYEEISAEQNVRFFASLYGLRGKELQERTEEALAFVGLSDRKDDKPKTFSGGMKRRLNIACAIAHQPEVIVMDEPTVGIDPQSRNHILDSIRQLREQGATILYTTHYMEEVEEISTRIMIIDHGEIIASGTKEELKDRLASEKLYEIVVDRTDGLNPDDLYGISGVKQVRTVDNLLRIMTVSGIDNLDQIIVHLMQSGIKIQHLTSSAASLESVFLQMTGRKLRD